MQSAYVIEEMLWQSPHAVVYKVKAGNGFRYALTRMVLPDPILSLLTANVFDAALTELVRLKHPNLRSAVDGGIDPIDGMPWVVQTWWDGDSLEDRIHDQEYLSEDAKVLDEDGQKLIGALGGRASALSFRAREIILTIGQNDEPIETFTIDALHWFLDWAMGFQPGFSRNAGSELDRLVQAAKADEIDPHLFPNNETIGTSPIKTHALPEAEPGLQTAGSKLVFQEPTWGSIKVY